MQTTKDRPDHTPAVPDRAPNPIGRAPSRRTSPWLIGLLAALVVAVGALAWAVWGATEVAGEALSPIAEEPVAEDGTVVVESIRGMSQLTTAEAVTFVTVERGIDTGILDWATGDRVGLLAVANVGAGIDLSEIDAGDVDADPVSGAITIRLPEPTILYVDIDEEASQVYDRDTGFFVDPDPDLEAEARIAAEGLLRDNAVESGLLDEATDRAVLVVTDLAEAFGYETVTVVP